MKDNKDITDKQIVIAIGGNSITRPGSKGTIEEQWAAADETCSHIAGLIQDGYRVILTHGNGPQVGNILLRSELASSTLPILPLDVCGADAQGAMGYMLQQLLDKELKKIGITKSILSLITQVIVNKSDPAFSNPTKPIGPFYSKKDAKKNKLEKKWDMIFDSGRGYRRVVASPKPVGIVELEAIKKLSSEGHVLICMGGGGIPVVQKPEGNFEGVAAVVDKDFTSSFLAKKLNADIFIISTAVDKICLNYNTEEEKSLDKITAKEAASYIEQGHFHAGSMLPKVEAALSFVSGNNKKAIITSPENLLRAVKGNAGTVIQDQ